MAFNKEPFYYNFFISCLGSLNLFFISFLCSLYQFIIIIVIIIIVIIIVVGYIRNGQLF